MDSVAIPLSLFCESPPPVAGASPTSCAESSPPEFSRGLPGGPRIEELKERCLPTSPPQVYGDCDEGGRELQNPPVFVGVRLRVDSTGEVRAAVRCFRRNRSIGQAVEQFSLQRLLQTVARVFPEPWTLQQASVIREWQAQAGEQTETVARLRRLLDSAQTHVDSLEERCAVLHRQLRRFEQRQLSFEGLHSAPTADPRREQAQLRRENRFLTEALAQTEADLFHVLHSYGTLTSGLLEEIDMHRNVQDSIKQLLLEAHDLSGNCMDRGLAELQAHRLQLLEKLTTAYRAAAAESQRAAALDKQNEELREHNAELQAQVARLRRGITPTGVVGVGYFD